MIYLTGILCVLFPMFVFGHFRALVTLEDQRKYANRLKQGESYEEGFKRFAESYMIRGMPSIHSYGRQYICGATEKLYWNGEIECYRGNNKNVRVRGELTISSKGVSFLCARSQTAEIVDKYQFVSKWGQIPEYAIKGAILSLYTTNSDTSTRNFVCYNRNDPKNPATSPDPDMFKYDVRLIDYLLLCAYSNKVFEVVW